MKKIYQLSVLVGLFAVLLPLFFIHQTDLKMPSPSPSPSSEPLQIDSPPVRNPKLMDSDTHFTVLFDDEVKCVNMADYLPHVVAAEMPATFEEEALKAQAVAARTYILYCTNHQNSNHPEANICTSSACCLAYSDEATLRGAWGASFDDNMEIVKKAVSDTDGQILEFNSQPILACFHSSSSGKTEDGVELWGDVPYLKAVDSPETSDDVPNFDTTVEVLDSDFKESILLLYPDTVFSDSPSNWIEGCENDESGRVRYMTICGQQLSGSELRKLFSLRSTAFSVTISENTFVFTVHGFGHGLGLSQYGANVMAENGKDYRKILSHYYPDTILSSKK